MDQLSLHIILLNAMVIQLLLVTSLVLSVLWQYSSVGKRLIKFTIYVAFCFSISILIPMWLFRPRNSKNALLPSAGFRALCKILELEYRVEGKENIVQNSGSVVLLNHQSILDLIVLCHLWPLLPKCTVIGKREILYYPLIGWAFWLCGAIFIDRSKPSEAKSAVNKTGEIIRKRQARVLMFPEGTRNSGSKLLPFKKGAFHLAVASKCPIQPIAVSTFSFLASNKFERGKIKIRILPAIPTENCTIEDVPRLIKETYDIISVNVEEISDT